MRMRVQWKQNAELKQMISRCFPGYRKQDVVVCEFGPTEINSYWDGGSKSEWTLVDLTNNTKKSLPTSTHPYFDVARYGVEGSNDVVEVSARGNITLKRLPANYALVETGYFCGKPATMCIAVNSDNLPKQISQ